MSEIKIQRIAQSRLSQTDLTNPMFGKVYSDHMFRADYANGKWQDPRIVPFENISISPANTTLHYSSTIFEGLKAQRSATDEILVFRPQANAQRMIKSAERMAIPPVSEELFLSAMDALLHIDKDWVPSAPGTSLYIRPFVFAMDPYIGIRPSDSYSFFIITGPVGSYYSKPVKVKIERHYTRAAAGGTGFAKTGGNYAAALYPAMLAQTEGYDQLIWTDGHTHEFVEESGTMNLMFVIDDTLLTAPTGDTILAGITRDSILTLARKGGMRVEERPIAVKEIIDAIKTNRLQEAFGAGTAATIAHIQTLACDGIDYTLPPIESRKYSIQLLSELTAIKTGVQADTQGWIYKIKGFE